MHHFRLQTAVGDDWQLACAPFCSHPLKCVVPTVHSPCDGAGGIHDYFYTTNTDGQHCSKFLDSDAPILTNKRVCTINVWLGGGCSRPTIMRFILHVLSALSEALTALKHTGPWETLFPTMLLESVVNFSGRDVFSNEKFDHNVLFHATFCSLITLATPRHDWTGSNPSRREGGGCGFTLSRSHSCCAVRLVYTQISPGHIWTTLYVLQVGMKIWSCGVLDLL